MKTTIKRPMKDEIATGTPLVRADLVKRGFRGNTLSEMAQRGILFRVARGVYIPVTGSTSAYFDYETLARIAPYGVFTLQSALRIHGLTDENPQYMTMAIPNDAHGPKTTLPVHFTYMKRDLLNADVEVKNESGTPFRVFSIERTIVECFKARNKIGLSLCVSALDEASKQKRLNWNHLWDVMKRCRMTRVISPYLEGRIS